MHRHLSRAIHRSVWSSSSTSQKQRQRPQTTTQTSQEYCNFGRREQAGTKHAQYQIVNALHFRKRNEASRLLSNLTNTDASLSASDFSFILDYCAQTPDPLFAMETCRAMEEKAVFLSSSIRRSIVRAFCRGGYVKEASDWVAYTGDMSGTNGPLPLHNLLLSGYTSSQNWVDAEGCLEMMDSQLVGRSEVTYSELLKLAVSQNSLAAVRDIWRECAMYYGPSIVMLRKFVWAFARLRDLGSASSVLQRMVALASQHSTSVFTSATGKYQGSRLDIPVPFINELRNETSRLEDKQCTIQLTQEENLVEMREDSKISIKDLCLEEMQPLCDINGNPKVDGVIDTLFHVPGSPVAPSDEEGRFGLGADNVQQPCPQHGMLSGIASVQVMNILRWSFNDLIHTCAQSKNCELVEQLFLQMQDLGLKPSQHTYDGFVKALIYGKGVAYGMKVVELMKERNIKPYNDTLAALSAGHSEKLELDQAEVLLEEISDSLPKYVHPFNAFFAACDAIDKPERAARVFSKMKRSGIRPNVRTYELLFSLFGNVNIPYEQGNMLSHADVTKRINTIEMDMEKNGVQHSYTSMKNLIRALGAEGMIKEMLQYFNVAENTLWHTNFYETGEMYNTVLHALVEAKESDRAIEVFKNMRLYGLPCSVATYNIMIECCSLLKCFKSACALTSMMLRHGFFPTIITYTALIKVLVANDDFGNALNLLDQSNSDEIQPDTALFNTILLEASIKSRIDVIERITVYMHERKIQPDPATCSYTFSAYVECGFHSTSLEALQVLSMRMISEEDSTLQEYRAMFEDLIHSEDPDADLQIINIFNQSEEYLATALLNLRWCLFAGLSLSWSPGESLWARRLSSCYSGTKVEI